MPQNTQDQRLATADETTPQTASRVRCIRWFSPMYEVLGEKSYLSTDYCPSRDYFVVELTDGNGREWYQLAYRGWWGLRWLNSIGHTDYGDSFSPMTFDSEDAARSHIVREREWMDRKNRAERVTARVIGE